MKTFVSWLSKQLLPSIVILILGFILNYLISHPYFPAYSLTYRTEILFGLIFFILLVIFLYFINWHWQRVRDLKRNFQVYKPVNKLEPSDFGIYTYYPFYLTRESDLEIKKSLKDNNIAFLSGMPSIGKTRGAYEIVKKFNDYYLLKPPYEKIEIQNLKFPFLFSGKKVILFLDDLEKYIGRFDIDELIYTLKKKCKELKVIANCRSGEEFNQILGRKEMVNLLSLCEENKVEPKKLSEKEEKDLAEGIGKKLEEVTSDGTPGSIVLGLDQMKIRYEKKRPEHRTILHILKLLKEANIFYWTKELIKNIAKIKIFELEGKSYEWDNWLKTLQENGFIKISDNHIHISHDSYLDNRFMVDIQISHNILIELREALFNLKDARNLFYLGNSFYRRRHPEEGIYCYQKAILIKPDFIEARNNLGVLLKDFKKYTEAESEFREILRIAPNDASSHINLGNLMHLLGKYSEAEKEYRETLRINAAHIEAHNNLGILLGDLGRYPEAETEYKEALRINPYSPQAHNNLGLLFYILKRFGEAEKEYRDALRVDSAYVEARNNLAILLAYSKRYVEAEKEYREALEINPNDAATHNNLGILLANLRRYPEAEKEYRETLRITPNFAEAHSNLGILLYVMGNNPDAEKELREALRIKPDFPDAHNHLGALLFNLKKYTESEMELREALRLKPDYADAHTNLGTLLKGFKKYSEAEKELREALSTDPHHAEARANLGVLYFEMGRKEEAKKELERARDIFKERNRDADVKKVEELLKNLESE